MFFINLTNIFWTHMVLSFVWRTSETEIAIQFSLRKVLVYGYKFMKGWMQSSKWNLLTKWNINAEDISSYLTFGVLVHKWLEYLYNIEIGLCIDTSLISPSHWRYTTISVPLYLWLILSLMTRMHFSLILITYLQV